MLMDISSELIHSLLPMFLTVVLGAPVALLGVIEGVAEATAAFAKLFSGMLSDRLGRRKRIAVLGYGLSALSKPLFPLATGVGWVFTARFADRVGKGLRGAPRDALIADLVTPQQRGAAYGLRQALDSAGAFIGPLLAVLLMAAFAGDLRSVLWVAVVPGALAVLLLALGVREPPSKTQAEAPRLRWSEAARLPAACWSVIGLGCLFTLARFSEAFLLLKAGTAGFSAGTAPLVMVGMNLVYSGAAYPLGRVADRLRPDRLLALGLGVLVAADLALAAARGPALVVAGCALWGLHMAFTQGLMSKLIADAVPAARCGAAFGLYNFCTGIALLLASSLAGALWSLFGPSASFLGGAGFAVLALAAAVLWGKRTIAEDPSTR